MPSRGVLEIKGQDARHDHRNVAHERLGFRFGGRRLERDAVHVDAGGLLFLQADDLACPVAGVCLDLALEDIDIGGAVFFDGHGELGAEVDDFALGA